MQNSFSRLVSLATLVVITLVVGSVSFAQTDPQFVWKWEQGDQYSVNLEQETIVLTTVDKRERQVDNITQLDFHWEVTDVGDDGTATIKQSIKRIRIKTGPPGVAAKTTVDFDTDIKKTATGLSRTLRKQALPLIDVEFTSTISQLGEVTSVTYSDETMELLRALPASTQIRKVFTKEGLQDLYGSAMIVLPASALDAGESWTVKKTVKHPTTMFNRSSNYTFAGIEGTKANFELTTEVTEAAQANGAESNQDSTVVATDASPSLSIKLANYVGDGEFTFDTQAGHLLESEIQSELETKASYQDKAMRTKVSTTIAMKVNKK